MFMSERKARRTKQGSLGETVRIIVHALILALIVRTFFYQPFNIPSGSMKETFALAELSVPTYRADGLPPELAAITAVKPGSRTL